MDAANLYCNVGAIGVAMENVDWDVKFQAQSMVNDLEEYFEPDCPYQPVIENNFDHPYVKEYGRHGDVPDFPVDAVEWVHGSPPCTGFSLANKDRGYFHPYNSDTVFFIKQAASFNPDVITLENVPGMDGILDDHPDIKKELEVDSWMELLEVRFNEYGYDMDWQVLNMANYGAAQTRKRIICVAIPNDAPEPKSRFPIRTHARNDKLGPSDDWVENPEPWVTQNDVFDDLPNAYNEDDVTTDRHDLTAGVPNHEPMDHDNKVIERYAIEARFGDPGAGYRRGDLPARTLLTKPILHPTRLRKTTPREMCRLMGLPDDFVLYGPKWAQHEVGTTIPVPFGEALARQVTQIVSA